MRTMYILRSHPELYSSPTYWTTRNGKPQCLIINIRYHSNDSCLPICIYQPLIVVLRTLQLSSRKKESSRNQSPYKSAILCGKEGWSILSLSVSYIRCCLLLSQSSGLTGRSRLRVALVIFCRQPLDLLLDLTSSSLYPSNGSYGIVPRVAEG